MITEKNTIESKIKMVEWFDDHWYKVSFDGKTDYLESTTTVLGVTAKPFLAHWRGDIGNREADLRAAEAAERGTRLHNAWSIFCQGGVVLFNPPQRPNFTFDEIDSLRVQHVGMVAVLPTQDEMYQMTKLQRLYDVLKPKKVITESIVFSLKNHRAGTADNFLFIEKGDYQVNGKNPLKLEGGLYVVDLKTGKTVDDDAFMQISDYAFMFEEMAELGVKWVKELLETYGKIAGGLIIHTSAKTKSGIEGLATLYRSRQELDQDQEDMNRIHAIWRRKNIGANPNVFELPTLITRTNKEIT
jgi:hypothetical protein